MSIKEPSSLIKKLRGLVEMALRRGAVALTLSSAGKNRAQQTSAAGTVVAALGAIVPTVNITPVVSGKLRVVAWLSYAAPAASGTARATLLSVQGASSVLRAVIGPTIGGGAIDLEIDGFTVGTLVQFSFATVAGDASITLGTGATGAGAGVFVQELA